MVQKSGKDAADLAAALLDIAPRILQHLRADVPFDEHGNSPLRPVTELRATPGQLTLLRVLVDHERCTMQELAEYLAVTPSTATAMVKRLLAQGYVERTRDDADWRMVWVKATEAGENAVQLFHQARLDALQARLNQLSEEERVSIIDALPALFHLIEL